MKRLHRCHFASEQAGGQKAALTKEEAKQLRQEKDPNFKAKADKAPREPGKRRKGLGFQEGGDTKRQKTQPRQVAPLLF